MTLSDITTLVNKLVVCLQSGGVSPSDQDLAEEYAEACIRVNERLAQCARMIDEGSSIQALMLAEEKPNLMEVVGALSFAQSKEWHEACSALALRKPPRIDREAVHKVNELYNKGNKTEQTKALYKQFRAAMAARNDAIALETIRTIANLDPADLDAAKEKARLERKRSEDLLKALGKALASAHDGEVLRLLEECQALDISGAPEIAAALEVQRQVLAEKARHEVAQMVPSLAELQGQGRWQQCGERARRVNSLVATYGLALSDSESGVVAKAMAYFESCRKESMHKARFKEALSALSDCADRTQAGERTASRRSLDEVEEQRLQLKKTYEKAKEFTLPIPETLVSRLGQIAADLDGEIVRLTKRRKIRNVAMMSGLALVLLTLVVGGYFIISAGLAAAELRAMVAETRALPLRKLTSEIQNKDSVYLAWPPLKSALLEAKAWLEGVDAQAGSAEKAMASARSLAEKEFSESSVDEAVAVFEQARNALAQLPSDLAATLSPQLSEAENRLSIWLATMRDEKVVAAKANIAKAREYAAKVDAASSGEELREAIAPLAESVEQLLNFANLQVEQVRLPQAMKAEVAEIVAKHEGAADVLQAYDLAVGGLSGATSLEEYSAAVENMAAVPLPRSPIVKAAQLLSTKRIDAHKFLGSIVLPDNPEIWSAIKSSEDLLSTPQPKRTNESEVERLRDLVNNEDIVGVHEATLQNRHGEPSSFTGRKIFIRGRMEISRPSQGATHATGSVYDPAFSGSKVNFEERTFEHEFTASTGMQRGLRVDKERESDASKSVQRLGLESLISSDGSRFAKNILEMIDRVMKVKNAPPLVKAFVIQELAAIVKSRPIEWGLPWVPAFELKLEQMEYLAGGKVQAGDWMVPGKAKASQQLEEWFARQEDFSLVAQQSVNRQLAKAALEAGLQVCGYVGLDGNLVETQKDAVSGANELWALSSQDGAPFVAYIRNAESLDGPLQPTGDALRLSPAFRLPLDRSEAVEAAMKSNQITKDSVALYIQGLPPIFAERSLQTAQMPNEQ